MHLLLVLLLIPALTLIKGQDVLVNNNPTGLLLQKHGLIEELVEEVSLFLVLFLIAHFKLALVIQPTAMVNH